MKVFLGALRLQVQLVRNNPDYLLDVATAPVYTVIFLAITQHAGRPDLIPHAVLAPTLITLWSQSLLTSGEVIDSDRHYGVLEPLVGTPASLYPIVLGRVSGVTVVSLLSFAESWITARLLFDVTVGVPHPLVFAVALVATAFAMAATATIMAGLFVRTRTARTFQNSLSYPFYIAGGVLVPVALLPDWLEPLTRVVFLSWSSDLLRDTLRESAVTDPAMRVLVILLLGVAALWLGRKLIDQVVDRSRRTGSMAHV